MRIESSVTSVSWIPSEAVAGLPKASFSVGVTHYDTVPPDALESEHIEQLGTDDRFRFCNELTAWIEVEDGRIVDYGQGGEGHIWNTIVKVGKDIAFRAVPLPDIRPEPEVGDGWVRFVQTAGGCPGIPAPRFVANAPFVQVGRPTAWTTLALTLYSDGRVEHDLVGASAFPRHWIYDGSRRLVQKTGTIEFKTWYRHSYGRHTPWGDENSPRMVTAVETALERDLSTQLMQGGTKPRVRKVKKGQSITEQGHASDHVFLVLDGVVGVEVDGVARAEFGPGSLLGERAALSDGQRTSTVRALTPVKIAVAPADRLDRAALEALSTGHQAESR